MITFNYVIFLNNLWCLHVGYNNDVSSVCVRVLQME